MAKATKEPDSALNALDNIEYFLDDAMECMRNHEIVNAYEELKKIQEYITQQQNLHRVLLVKT